MPGNGFAFPVRVGCQNQPVIVLQGIGNIRQALGGFAVHFPGHGKILVRAHRAILGWQVAHMAVGGQHDEVRAQVFIDGFCLCGRFDDDDGHSSS